MIAAAAEVGLIHGAGFEVVDDRLIISNGSRLNAERGAQLLSHGIVPLVICSGGGPIYGETYPASEASLMADHLIRIGVDHRKIEIEDISSSFVGNWSKSAPIIRELGATWVLGVSAEASVARNYMIGDFVGARSGFGLAGYTTSAVESTPKDRLRELVNRQVIRLFLNQNQETPIDSLEEAYEEFKGKIGLSALKKFVHRAESPQSEN